ncbi:MAG: restriction endonuclease subunit S [Burkholderiales bacterium]|jgi:type I restriction enzyme S subunit|nr:restriction endonuclease subunit S [Burkholderiales bacterium]
MSAKWPKVKLGEVLTERREEPSPDALASGRIRIVEKIGFNTGRIQLRSDGKTKTGMILIKPGDLVLSGINVAKGAVAIYDKNNAEPIAATVHYGAYIPNSERVSINFLWWMFRSNFFQELLLEYFPGGIKTELKAKRLLSISAPLPLLPEQQRIVARIEELAGQINEARHLRKRTIEEAEFYFRSAISDIFARLPAKAPLSVVLSDKPRNGWSAKCDNSESGVPVLTLSAVTGFQYNHTAFKRTSEFIYPTAHYWLNPGDLLITRSNTPELVGHVAIYDGNPTPCIYPDLMMKLNINKQSANPRFVWFWLQSGPVREYIRDHAKGTSPTMKKISQGVVMAIPFPDEISLSEQRCIVAELDTLQATVNKLKRLQTDTASELDALLPSILDKAFKGEL